MPFKCLDVPRNFRGEPWARVPEPEGEFCGLPSDVLLELAEEDHIRVVSLKRGDRVIRLVFVPSLHSYLRRLPPLDTAAKNRATKQTPEVVP